MARQLEKPDIFIRPCLLQARADYHVAVHLLITKLDDRVHNGSEPFDAALAKFQQALEKALGAIILHWASSDSDLVFLHRYLTESEAQQRPKAKRALDKLLQLFKHIKGMRLRLEALERIVPNPDRAGFNKNGKITALPENSEYPYTTQRGRAIAPCESFGTVYHSRFLNIQKDLGVLFKALSKIHPFRSIMQDFYP
ncbi:MAG: hypothetical protein NTX50_07150 [Candidatus Sumerlaeota bacterium]|nr:hypothetical protein [Candidatus Sumerlaeota bacterium]